MDSVCFYGHVVNKISNKSLPPGPWMIFNNTFFIYTLQNKFTPTYDSDNSPVVLLQCTNIQLSKFYSSVADGFWNKSKSKEICVVGRNHNTVLGIQQFINWKYQFKVVLGVQKQAHTFFSTNLINLGLVMKAYF